MNTLEQMQQLFEAYMENGDIVLLRKTMETCDRLYHCGNNDAGYLLAKCHTVASMNSLDFGSIDQAITIYRKLILDQYENHYVYVRLGQIYEHEESNEDAFDCFERYHTLIPDDAEGNFYLAKCYKNGVGTDTDYEKAKKLLDSIMSSEFAKDNEFFASEYGELLAIIGNYKEANKWYQYAYELTDDEFAKVGYAESIIDLHLEHNVEEYSSPLEVVKGIQKYVSAIEQIDQNSKDSPDYSDIHEGFLLMQNTINIYLAENRNGFKDKIEQDVAMTYSTLLAEAREALVRGNYSVAMQYYKNVSISHPGNAEAVICISLLRNDNSTIENYSHNLATIQSAVSDTNIAALRQTLSLSDTPFVTEGIANAMVHCAYSINQTLIDTFKMLVSTRSTYQRLAPVGFSRNIIHPTLGKIGQLMYQLGDAFEREFESSAKNASKLLWEKGNIYMAEYSHNLGFFEKMSVKSTIRKYTEKIK